MNDITPRSHKLTQGCPRQFISVRRASLSNSRQALGTSISVATSPRWQVIENLAHYIIGAFENRSEPRLKGLGRVIIAFYLRGFCCRGDLKSSRGSPSSVCLAASARGRRRCSASIPPNRPSTSININSEGRCFASVISTNSSSRSTIH
jgi:hypothetical protein